MNLTGTLYNLYIYLINYNNCMDRYQLKDGLRLGTETIKLIVHLNSTINKHLRKCSYLNHKIVATF